MVMVLAAVIVKKQFSFFFKENLNGSLNISSLRSNLLELEIPQPSELQMYKSPRWQDYKSREM